MQKGDIQMQLNKRNLSRMVKEKKNYAENTRDVEGQFPLKMEEGEGARANVRID